MIKHTSIFFIIISLTSSCASNKIKLEDYPLVNITEAYYTTWVSGVNGGGSGLNLHLTVAKEDINKRLIGLYFRNSYTNLKFNKPNIYTGFIRTSEKTETNLDLLVIKKPIKPYKENDYKLPFTIKENEAVLVSLVHKKKKYFILTVKKKESMDFPR